MKKLFISFLFTLLFLISFSSAFCQITGVVNNSEGGYANYSSYLYCGDTLLSMKDPNPSPGLYVFILGTPFLTCENFCVGGGWRVDVYSVEGSEFGSVSFESGGKGPFFENDIILSELSGVELITRRGGSGSSDTNVIDCFDDINRDSATCVIKNTSGGVIKERVFEDVEALAVNENISDAAEAVSLGFIDDKINFWLIVVGIFLILLIVFYLLKFKFFMKKEDKKEVIRGKN